MILESEFREAWWLPGGHLQTVWPVLANPRIAVKTHDEVLELPDGDALTLSWLARDAAPIVTVFHGLEGGKHSHYARRILPRLHGEGFSVVLMHFRGCDGKPNRLARSYHSGDTGDIDFLLRTLRDRFPNRPILSVGYSLGGNALLKYLAEQGKQAVPSAAVTVSVPLELDKCANRMRNGLSRIYQSYLLRMLRKGVRRKRDLIAAQGIDVQRVHKHRDFWTFDNEVTAPLHGFANAAEYYTVSSSRQFLKRIEADTLILQAYNDPFTTPDVLPHDTELAASVRLEIARGGGHVGFVTGSVPGRAVYWLDKRVSEFLCAAVQTADVELSTWQRK
ncbi:MAG: hydrolase [Gammaproteobacteria bacterium]|nr:hydrolase [Gammaproteobacteria bacterium]